VRTKTSEILFSIFLSFLRIPIHVLTVVFRLSSGFFSDIFRICFFPRKILLFISLVSHLFRLSSKERAFIDLVRVKTDDVNVLTVWCNFLRQPYMYRNEENISKCLIRLTVCRLHFRKVGFIGLFSLFKAGMFLQVAEH
jgi:hypothetical protein